MTLSRTLTHNQQPRYYVGHRRVPRWLWLLAGGWRTR